MENGGGRGGEGLGLVDVVGDGEGFRQSAAVCKWMSGRGSRGGNGINGERFRKTALGRGSFAGMRDVISIGLHQSKGEAAKRGRKTWEFGRIPLIDVANIPLMRITF
ncbi:hypothetical protein HPP92_011807 [Vanilla planifolia]|uniref:Uncharacterized protein n=1 Tax=Vanilla planifolia TaxID=51239 RepID=A0A835RC68_VANPL|nr:hypothetical protein HPP92_012154 [Vanilla planifolia]KAG0483723.1 hypothetical protein HPP92_011807 [Vanilla planifolia]